MFLVYLILRALSIAFYEKKKSFGFFLVSVLIYLFLFFNDNDELNSIRCFRTDMNRNR